MKKPKEVKKVKQSGGTAKTKTAQAKSFTPPDSGINFTVQKKENKTGMPNQLKSGLENMSGMDLSDVRVHYNSSQPKQLNAHAYAQGNQIHIAPGQEKHLPHEGWHVVQQKQGRVKPTKQLKSSVAINDDVHLEKEADVMGAKAAQLKTKTTVKKQAGKLKASGKNTQRKAVVQLHTAEQIEYFNTALALLVEHETIVSAAEPEIRQLFVEGRFDAFIEAKTLLEEIKRVAGEMMPTLPDGEKLIPMGRGSSHKIAFAIQGDNANCFVAIPEGDAGKLVNELKLYDRLAHVHVRIPRIYPALIRVVFKNVRWVGVVMERMNGKEYKQTLTWMYVKKQIATWPDEEKKAKLIRLVQTIEVFLGSRALVTDLQVFILDSTGEMVVFDPSTVSIEAGNVHYGELADIVVRATALIATLP